MERAVSRRRTLAVVGAAAAAGCTTDFETPSTRSTPSTASQNSSDGGGGLFGPSEQCQRGEAFYLSMEHLDVEPAGDDPCYPGEVHCENGSDANPDKVPRLQRTVPPGVRVEHDGELADADDFSFYGRVTEDIAVAACRANDVDVGTVAWESFFTGTIPDTLSKRLGVFQSRDVGPEGVSIEMVEPSHYAIYDRSVPDDVVHRTNQMLEPMGQLAISLGDPASGRWVRVPGTEEDVSLSGTTLTVPLTGEPVRQLLAAYDVPSDPSRYPLRVYVDGFHAASFRMTPSDLDGARFARPYVDVGFDNVYQAAAFAAALRYPARSTVDVGSACDTYEEPTD